MPVLQEWADEKSEINQPSTTPNWWPISKNTDFILSDIENIL